MNKKYDKYAFKKDVIAIFEKYKDYLWERIPGLTKEKWKIKSIGFRFSSRTPNWTTTRSKIIAGTYLKRKRKILCSIIHESIHLNTPRQINALKGSRENINILEIATCVLTNILINKINKKFHTKYLTIHFDEPYKKYEKIEPEFKKLFYKSKDFDDFLHKIKERYFSD